MFEYKAIMHKKSSYTLQIKLHPPYIMETGLCETDPFKPPLI